MIELIVSDMDGTLLSHHFDISQENVQSIHKATEKGVPFIVATGRHFTEAKPLLTAHNIDCPIITLNGAATYKSDGTLVNMHPINTDRVLHILQHAQQYSDLLVDIVTVDGVTSDKKEVREKQLQSFMRSFHPELDETALAELFTKQRENFPALYVPSLEHFINVSQPDILKVIVMATDKTPQLTQLKQDLSALPDITVTSSHPLNIEINAPLAQKGIAVNDFAKKNGIALENVLALGDNDNDISMLSTVGYGIAMANAAQHIQDLAYAVTDSHEHHGVARAIHKYVLDNITED